MSGRGGAIGRPRGRPNKVTKPPIAGGRGRGHRQSSVTADHIDAQLRDDDEEDRHSVIAKTEHLPDQDEDGEHDDVVDEDHHGHPNHHHPGAPSQQQQQHQHEHQPHFDLSSAAHGLLPNGPSQAAQQQAEAIHSALQGLVPGPGAHQQQQQQQQPPHSQHQQQQHHQAPPPPPQNFAMEAPMDAGPPRTAIDLSKESGYPALLIDSALAKRLADNTGVRLAVQRRQDQGLNLKRRSNVEALLAHVSGQEAHSQCKSCHKGYGPWNGCIVVSGQMCGSCANCWFNASGSRCSFHETNLPQQHQHIPAIQLQHSVPVFTGLAGPVPPGLPAPPPPPPQHLQQQQQQQQQQLGPNFAPGGLDQYVRSILDRHVLEARADDPHVRYQFRIDAAARQLALATAEYSDFLQAQQAHEQQQQQQQHEQGPEGDHGQGMREVEEGE
ncbi:hypothetical protein D7B24_003789 [Verticillium nonalfalfae]|uniref:Uncharacterized protein n=1 Tax=Verticillium nonalfalfae TaxID=1051616 RepID=A0A3M9YES6_9PEZI|nr:uncharacterized protein D7B24_003789 [Verticillium nonalfalfae]RNJ58969.1 hypothetical protein D7B24_003789 [Verticillium nonalfalfae]